MDEKTHIRIVKDTVAWFSHQQKKVLLKPENLAKINWREGLDQDLLKKLSDNYWCFMSESNQKKELCQLINIGNYAMMLADRIRVSMEEELAEITKKDYLDGTD